jgi:hypothetical protein
LLATIIQEIVANILTLRGRILKQAIQRMLDDDTKTTTFSESFYHAPLIKYMVKKDGKKPAYLAARNFSKVVIDILRGKNPTPGDDFRVKIDTALSSGIELTTRSPKGEPESFLLNAGGTFEFLQSLWADANGDIEKFRTSLEQWYDDTMERASSWYKRWAQVMLFIIGLAIAATFNVDTIQIIGKLSKDPELRQQLVEQAEAYIREHPNFKEELAAIKEKNPDEETLKNAQEEYDAFVKRKDMLMNKADSLIGKDIKNVNQVLGSSWTEDDRTWGCIIADGFLGWIITALAISLGAPFWFDLLNKLMKIRAAVPPSSTDDKKPKTADGKVIVPKG